MRTPAIFVAGLPGCGKTTLCLAARERFGLPVVRYRDLVADAGSAGRSFDELLQRAAPAFPTTTTLFDSMPKGAEQARRMCGYVSPRLAMLVSSDRRTAERRAAQRSPERFAGERIREKFGLRARQTEELRDFCRAGSIPVETIANDRREDEFIAAGLHILERHLTART